MYKVTIALLCAWCFCLSAQFKREPDDLAVSKYKMLRDKYEDEFELEAGRAPKVVELETEIAFLSKPLKMKDNISIDYDTGRGWVKKEGMLSEVTPSRVVLSNIRVCKKDFIKPLTWTWLQGVNDPEKLKKIIEEKKSQISEQKEKFVKTRTDQKMIDLGYNKEFLKNSIILGDYFAKKKDLGHRSIYLTVIEYLGAEHMQDFIELEVTYRGDEAIAGVLVAENPNNPGKEIPLCAIGQRKKSGKIAGREFKRVKFFLSKEEIKKKLGAAWSISFKNSRFVMMKHLHGMWSLKAAQNRTERGASNVACSDCWGNGKVEPVGAVDISSYAKKTLDQAKAKDEIRNKGYEIVGKYKRPEDQGTTRCPTCRGSGEASRKSRVRGIKIMFGLDPESPKKYTEKEYKAFENLYTSVTHSDSVDEVKAKYRQKHIQKRKDELIAKGKREIDELVSEFTEKYMDRAYDLLEKRFRNGWMTRKELLAKKDSRSPGVGPVLLSGEPDGYAPEQLYGHKVRRFSEWLLLRDFQRIDSIEKGYNLNPVYYRVVEVGGADIDAEVETPKPGTTDAPDDMMEGDGLRRLPPAPSRRNGRNGRRPPADPEYDEMMDGRGMPPGEGAPEAPAEQDENPVPDDIKKRIYIIQYAASFNTDKRDARVTTKMVVNFKPEIDPNQEINFTLAPNEKSMALSHKFNAVAGWRGWLIGSKIISFEQLLSNFDYKTIKFGADIQ